VDDDSDSHDDGMTMLRIGYRNLGAKRRLWSVMSERSLLREARARYDRMDLKETLFKNITCAFMNT